MGAQLLAGMLTTLRREEGQSSAWYPVRPSQARWRLVAVVMRSSSELWEGMQAVIGAGVVAGDVGNKAQPQLLSNLLQYRASLLAIHPLSS